MTKGRERHKPVLVKTKGTHDQYWPGRAGLNTSCIILAKTQTWPKPNLFQSISMYLWIKTTKPHLVGHPSQFLLAYASWIKCLISPIQFRKGWKQVGFWLTWVGLNMEKSSGFKYHSTMFRPSWRDPASIDSKIEIILQICNGCIWIPVFLWWCTLPFEIN